MRYILLCILLLSPAAASAADVEVGRVVAIMCEGCHGRRGFSARDGVPNLAGQGATYLMKQLKSFKAGSRRDTVMEPMAAQLSDSDMAAVAAYFEEQRP